MPWQPIQAQGCHLLVRKAPLGAAVPELELLVEAPAKLELDSNATRLRVPLRNMIARLYLRRAINVSDDGIVEPPRSNYVSARTMKGWTGCWIQAATWRSRSQLAQPKELKRVIVDGSVTRLSLTRPPTTASPFTHNCRGLLNSRSARAFSPS